MSTVSITTYVDTDLTTDTVGTFGSIQTNTGGRGMYEAGQEARRQILDWGAKKFIDDAKKANQTLDLKADDMDMKDGMVFAKSDPAKKAALKERALADAGVQALLEVFPAEIRDVEEM